ncbi:hypothetical protein Barb4_01696 [Bacteroidales bacterium Barb4]|nr:hypothetical protein Barb4_01696 [Bacteroidales bacterium Barb4]
MRNSCYDLSKKLPRKYSNILFLTDNIERNVGLMWGNVGFTDNAVRNALKGQWISAPHAAQRNVGFWQEVIGKF